MSLAVMTNKLEKTAPLRLMEGRLSGIMIILAAGLVLLLTLAGQAHSRPVKEVNAGSPGQTLDLRTLPKRGKTTLVDVYSPYCPPCMRLAPILEKLARKRRDLAVRKVNIQRPEVKGRIDWKSPLAKQLQLRAIPYFLIFNQEGKLVAQGKEARTQMVQWLMEAGLLKRH